MFPNAPRLAMRAVWRRCARAMLSRLSVFVLPQQHQSLPGDDVLVNGIC